MTNMEKKVCLICGGKKNLTIHHLTARTLRKVKNENNVEKIVLCRGCHDLVEFEKQGMKWNKKLETARQQAQRKILTKIEKIVDETDYMGYVKEINHFSNKELNKQIRKDLKFRFRDK